jgi:hypothetical protein
MSYYVYVLQMDDRHLVSSCEGSLEEAIAEHAVANEAPVILLWAEAVADKEMADMLVPLIEALDDERYANLLAGEDEARSLLIDPLTGEEAVRH